MRINRTRALAIVTTGATVLGLGLFGVTQAYAEDRERKDTVCDTNDCVDFEYIEHSGSVAFRPAVKVSADAKVCPGAAEIAVNATAGYAVTQEKSSGLSGGGELSLMGVLNAQIQKAGGTAVATTTQVGQEFAGTITEGNIGHALFEAKVYKSSGDMNWTEEFHDEFNSTATFVAALSSETPVTLSNGLADGEYSIYQRPMTAEELASKC